MPVIVLLNKIWVHFVGGETALDRMHRICVAIWETGEWPEEWTFSTLIPLPKKGDLKQCDKSSAVAEMGDRGHSRHGPTRGGLLCPFRGRWDPV